MQVKVVFGYTFGTGRKITGTAMGELQSDGVRVLNLSKFNAVYSDEPARMLTFFYSPGELQLPASSPSDYEIDLNYFESTIDTANLEPNFGFEIDGYQLDLSRHHVPGRATVAICATARNGFSFEEYRDNEQFRREAWSAEIVQI